MFLALSTSRVICSPRRIIMTYTWCVLKLSAFHLTLCLFKQVTMQHVSHSMGGMRFDCFDRVLNFQLVVPDSNFIRVNTICLIPCIVFLYLNDVLLVCIWEFAEFFFTLHDNRFNIICFIFFGTQFIFWLIVSTVYNISVSQCSKVWNLFSQLD